MLGCEIILAAITAAQGVNEAERHCRTNDWGLAVARSAEDATNYLLALEEGRRRFQDTFHATPEKTAIIQGNAAYAAASGALGELGYQYSLPWVDQVEQDALIADQIRTQVAASGVPISEASLQAQIDGILEGRRSEPPGPDRARGLIAHEFGHIWFMSDIWDDDTRTMNHYGGSAPDWLDELAAVALESPDLTESRRERFRADQTSEDRLSLARFFEMTHPSAEIARRVAAERGGERPERVEPAPGQRIIARTMTLTGEDARRVIAGSDSNPLSFYSMARGVLDYFADEAEPGALLALSSALRNGDSLDDWLAGHGADFGLASSASALENDWDRWVTDQI